MRTILLAAVIATSPVDAAPTDLTAFFGKFHSCETSSEFDYFGIINIMRHVYQDQNYSSARMPAHIESAIIFDRAENHADHVEVTFAVAGSFNNIPLERLVLWLGKENGIFAASLGFAIPHQEVRMWFGQDVEKTNQAAASSNEMLPRAGIPEVSPGSIVCDWST